MPKPLRLVHSADTPLLDSPKFQPGTMLADDGCGHTIVTDARGNAYALNAMRGTWARVTPKRAIYNKRNS